MFALQPLGLAEVRDEAAVGLLADRARVEQDQVGLGRAPAPRRSRATRASPSSARSRARSSGSRTWSRGSASSHGKGTGARARADPPSAAISSAGTRAARAQSRPRARSASRATRTVPLWASAIARTIASPSPAPPLGRARPAAVGAVEALEHALALGRRDPGTVVDNHEADAIRREPGDVETHEAVVLIGVLDRVAGEVAQRLGEPIGVGVQRAVRRPARARTGDRRSGSCRPRGP